MCSDEERVVIALRDKGGGIPLKSLPQIWSPIPGPADRMRARSDGTGIEQAQDYSMR